jgi:predicted metal-dependent peptidase
MAKEFDLYYGSKSQVYKGTAKMTKGGLQKKDIKRIKDKYGNIRYKSKDQQKSGKKKRSFREKWANAMRKARKELIKEGVIDKGDFVPVGGSSREGKALLKRIREIVY